jgi:hypothetical protein
MNPIALYFASGESLYTGSLLMLLLMAITPRIRNRWLRRLHALLIWIALAMILMACPPFHVLIYAIFLAAFVAWLIAWAGLDPKTSFHRRTRLITAIVFAFLLLLLPAMELPGAAKPRQSMAATARLPYAPPP